MRGKEKSGSENVDVQSGTRSRVVRLERRCVLRSATERPVGQVACNGGKVELCYGSLLCACGVWCLVLGRMVAALV